VLVPIQVCDMDCAMDGVRIPDVRHGRRDAAARVEGLPTERPTHLARLRVHPVREHGAAGRAGYAGARIPSRGIRAPFA